MRKDPLAAQQTLDSNQGQPAPIWAAERTVREMWFWPVVAVVTVSGLTTLFLLDRRSRRMGHVPRSGSGIYRSIRESHRDIRVFDATNGWLSTTHGLGWTAWHRRNTDSARENRRDDSGD